MAQCATPAIVKPHVALHAIAEAALPGPKNDTRTPIRFSTARLLSSKLADRNVPCAEEAKSLLVLILLVGRIPEVFLLTPRLGRSDECQHSRAFTLIFPSDGFQNSS